MPDVPPPGDLKSFNNRHLPDGVTSFQRLIDQRRIPAPQPRADGRVRTWFRIADGISDPRAMTTTLVTTVADFLIGTCREATARHDLSTNSLDNVIRFHHRLDTVDTEWILLDARVTAVRSGIFHGDARLFGEDGTLLATSNQSGLARLPRTD